MLLKKIILTIFLIISSFSTLTCRIQPANEPRIDEFKYIGRRNKIIRPAIEAITGRTDISYYPKIAVIGSGGGYRAMLEFYGFLAGMVDATFGNYNLLDAATYMAGLSGSTWTIGTMLAKQAEWGNKNNLHSFFSKVIPDIRRSVDQSFFSVSDKKFPDFYKKLKQQDEDFGTIQIDDVWGGLLGKNLMVEIPGQGQFNTFAPIRDYLNNYCAYPYPILTTIIKDTFDITAEYEWFEITPYLSGSFFLNAFLPTEYLGSEYDAGERTEELPEFSLARQIGTCGSPFVLSVGDLLLQACMMIPEEVHFWKFNFSLTGIKRKVMKEVSLAIQKYKLGKHYTLKSPINNPTYNLDKDHDFYSGREEIYKDRDKYHPAIRKDLQDKQITVSEAQEEMYKKAKITFADAGDAFNLPFPPFLSKLDGYYDDAKYRDVDIIICCDSSSDSYKPGFPELKDAAAYAKRHGLAFPSISQKPKKLAPYIYLFEKNDKGEVDPDLPMIIYVEIPKEYYYKTLKLRYSQSDSGKIVGYTYDQPTQHKDVFAKAIASRCG